MGRFDGDIVLIDVRRFNRLGREISRRTKVRHESPQVIVLRDGEAVWDAHHGGIDSEEVKVAVEVFR